MQQLIIKRAAAAAAAAAVRELVSLCMELIQIIEGSAAASAYPSPLSLSLLYTIPHVLFIIIYPRARIIRHTCEIKRKRTHTHTA
jgi:hypothetical protein